MSVGTKENVIDAVLYVANQNIHWNVPYDYLEKLYDEEKIGNDDEFQLQVNKLGDKLRRKFHSRHITYYDATRLDNSMFRHSGADEYIRLLDWYKSYDKGCLIDCLGNTL